MLISIAYILLFGLFAGWLCKKTHFPTLFGMILVGILIGPYCLNLLDESILNISTEIRRIALIIILIRAGLKLDFNDLKKNGKSSISMCFLPACFEILGMVLIAPTVLGLSVVDSAILGSVLGAVSPAVVVPRMIQLIDENRGTDKGIPQMILCGASVDDVFVIVMFTTFTNIATGGKISVMRFVNVPISIGLGVIAGMLIAKPLEKVMTQREWNTTLKVIVFFSISLVLNYIEEAESIIPFAGLIAIMAMGMQMRKENQSMAKEIAPVLDQLWVPAEVFLFVLVGASVAITSLQSAGFSALLAIIGALGFRMIGVLLCTLGTTLNKKERLFCMLAYTPKATVQAAIGGLPLAMGLSCGELVLTISVIAILLTAPFGAFAIDLTKDKLLN